MEELKRQFGEHVGQFREHIAEDRRINMEIHTTLRDIQEAQRLVNINHLPHIETHLDTLTKSDNDKAIAIAKMATDAEWTKKIMFAVLTVAIAGVGGLFFSLFGKG